MKEQIVYEVLKHLPTFSSDQISDVKEAVRMVLYNYEISEKQTKLQTINNSYIYYINMYCESLLQYGRSSGTVRNYKFHLTKLLSYINLPINSITDEDIFMYLSSYKKLRQVSNRYLDNIRIVFNGFFTWLVKRKILQINPMYSIDPIKTPKSVKKPYSPKEMEQMRSACNTERDLSIIDCLYSSAIRVSEIAGLNRSDISFTDNEIIVLGKGNKERVTYLNDKSLYHLKRYLDLRTDHNNALFVSQNAPHKRLTTNGFRSIIKRIGTSANVEKAHPHRFRRTSATDLLNAGMPIEQVQELLGHESIETTRLYCSVNRQSVKHNHQRLMNF